VMRRVRAEVGDDFVIGVRFLGEECIRNGYTVMDAGPIAIELVRAGADYVSLSAGGKFEDARIIEGEPLYPYTGYSGDRCMPGAAYPDGANLAMPEAVRAALRAAGHDTPVVAVGKVGTKELASKILARGQGDLVGMARALLADPDLPKKWARGEEERVVRCLYGNVCKTLDENFKRVDCTLWPKKLGQAPESDDTIAPAWAESGAALVADHKEGRVLLQWRAATDNEAMYGYQVLRGEELSNGGALLTHHASVRALSTRYEDARVMPGVTYRYAVRPYDLAGNRGPVSPTVHVRVPE
jgi:dimethylglycine catabolism A